MIRGAGSIHGLWVIRKSCSVTKTHYGIRVYYVNSACQCRAMCVSIVAQNDVRFKVFFFLRCSRNSAFHFIRSVFVKYELMMTLVLHS